MNDAYFLFSVFIFGLAITITPGPNNLMLLSLDVNFAFVKTVPHAIDRAGNLIMFAVCGVGIATVFLDVPSISFIMKLGSVIFIIYSAWKYGTTPTQNVNTDKNVSPLNFFNACLFQWINPKAWIFSITTITLFADKKNSIFETVPVTRYCY